MTTVTTDFLYLLDQSGSSDNGKVVRELVPNSTANSTEQTDDNTLMVGEDFSVFFTSLEVETRFGGLTFTYIGTDLDVPGAVAQGSDGNFYLFSNDGTIAIGTNLNKIEAVNIPLCFMAGTMIATPEGARAVETLKIGDLIRTADGRAVSVKWIGKQTIVPFFGLPEGRRPVCIAAGALGEDCPVRELRVTADHALLIDGVLVQAGALVNGGTVRRVTPAELGERFAVFHIETENHELVLAEGAPAETFIDNVTRECFDNYAEFEALYGDAREPMQELPHPRAKSFRQVPPSIRAKISERAADVSRRLAGAA